MKVNIANQEFTTTFLSDKGLSMTDAKSISNFCNQQALEIERVLNSANVHDKKFMFNGEQYPVTEGKSLPSDVIPLLIEKANYHACQAWLMEAMKEKDNLLLMVNQEPFVYIEKKPKEPDKDYREAYENWLISRNIAESEYEISRYALLRKISELKIIVEPQFQNILNEFNKK